MESQIEQNLHRLHGIVREMGSVLVAFSGGIDSSLVLKVAHDVLGDRAESATAVSPAVADSEVADAQRVASWIGARHLLIPSGVVEDPAFSQNDSKRCYICKRDLYRGLTRLALSFGFDFVANGVHQEDLGDFRPGIAAAREFGIRSPLLEAELGKADIRNLGKALGLPNWDKPADACLSSRMPRGTMITEDRLRQIEQAEAFLKKEGFRQVRVRYHHEVARIELAPVEMGRTLDPALRERIVSVLKSIGFQHITIDLEGYRQGSLNRRLP